VITIRVDIRGAIAAFDRVRKVKMRPIFRAARKPIRADLRDHAAKMEGPDGRWQGRAQSTRDRRGNRGRLLRRLPTAWAFTESDTHLRGVSLVKWSGAHISGARVGHGTRLPRRNFSWISRVARMTVRRLFVDALRKAWKG
jgi:hypothetical protein